MKKIYVVGMCMLLLATMFVAAKANNVKLRDVFPYGKETAEAIKNGELLYTIDLEQGWNTFTYDSRFMPPVDQTFYELQIKDGDNIYTYEEAADLGIVGKIIYYRGNHVWLIMYMDEFLANRYGLEPLEEGTLYQFKSNKPNLKLIIT